MMTWPVIMSNMLFIAVDSDMSDTSFMKCVGYERAVEFRHWVDCRMYVRKAGQSTLRPSLVPLIVCNNNEMEFGMEYWSKNERLSSRT